MTSTLLIFPPITLEERYSKKLDISAGGFQPPLGLAYIAALLEQNGLEVGIIDAPTQNMSSSDVLSEIKRRAPDIVGISVLTPNAHRGLAIAREVKDEFSNTKIILGGPHASILGKRILEENSFVDIVVQGEGEYTALEIAQGHPLEQVNGICYRVNGTVVSTSPRGYIENLDKLPFPARHLLPMRMYRPHPNQYSRLPVVHMLATRGCPYRCTFCSKSVFGRIYRTRSANNVIDEIKLCMQEFKAKEIAFVDDEFVIKRSWTLEFCNRLIDDDLDIVWRCSARVNTVDRQLLELMAKAGCYDISYGIEAGSQLLLDTIRKDITLDQVRDAVKWTKEAGIGVTASFMLALPGESPDLAEKTIDFAIELDPAYAQFCVTTPYPGTELYRQCQDYGVVRYDYSKYTIWDPVFVPHGYKDEEEIRQIERSAFKRFYLRPKYIWKQLKKIRSIEDLKRNFDGFKMLMRW